jgi:monoamine oxidase
VSDIVIVGAGAAGIAAARWLQEQGQRPLVLEARDRVGGRAWTDSSLGVPVDMGCAWLHSADQNPWTAYALEHHFEIIERRPDWGRRVGREEPGATYQAEFAAAYESIETRIAEAAARGLDIAVSELVPDGRFKLRFDAIMGWWMGANSAQVSCLDMARYADSDINWAVRAGLGAVIAHSAGALDVRFNTAVREIDSSGPRVKVVSDAGVVEAKAVIVTVPTNLLAAHHIRFSPELPAAFNDAFAGLPQGANNKVFFRMVPGAVPYEGTVHFIGSDTTIRTATYATRPSGQEALLAYFGGDLARELEQRGELAAFAREELTGIFGADFGAGIVGSVSSAWSTDPWSLGSYSIALPGKAHLRQQLSEPVQERIFFAGEACSIEYFGTIHGAWHSAVNAAGKALARIESLK